MGISLGRSATAKACAAALVLSLPVAAGAAWADAAGGADDVASSGKAAAFAAESGVLPDDELNEFGIAAADATPIVDWTACGTCEWMIDSEGCLTIRPANGAESGELDATIPWGGYRDKVRAVEVEGKVKAQTLKYAFYQMGNLVRADLSNLDTSGVSSME